MTLSPTRHSMILTANYNICEGLFYNKKSNNTLKGFIILNTKAL